jgi:ATP-dependent DNA helicase RecG
MPPVKYDGRIWITTGPRRSIANEQEERTLSAGRRFKNLPFDIYPIPGASLDDLSSLMFEGGYLPAAFAPGDLDANSRTYEERLASCKMIVSPDSPTSTVLGILSIGKNPEDLLPGAREQFLRINGTALADQQGDIENLRPVEPPQDVHRILGTLVDDAVDVDTKEKSCPP